MVHTRATGDRVADPARTGPGGGEWGDGDRSRVNGDRYDVLRGHDPGGAGVV